MKSRLRERGSKRFVFLSQGAVSFGVAKSNDFVFDEPGLPEICFQILCEGQEVRFMRMGAAQAKVNGKSVDLAVLSAGDLITCGRHEFEFLPPDSKLSLEEAASGVFDSYAGLESLFDAVGNLLRHRDPMLALPAVLETGCRVMQADYGVLCCVVEGKEQSFHWPDDSVTISNSAVKHALEQGQAVLWNQEDADTPFDATQSIVQNELSSIVVHPFWLDPDDKRQGFLYMQRKARTSAFGARDQAFFGTLADFCRDLALNSWEKARQDREIDELRGLRKIDGFLYADESMKKLVALLDRAAGMPVPVMILGDTGTGKEVLARQLHERSMRAGSAFVAVNCGAIPANLMESELFGHVKGSFTGAVADKKGIFEDASGGTLFLDEVGELPPELQVKLLRVLQEKKVSPVGTTREIPVDIRLISATHVDLEKAMREGRFREDLFFRLNVMPLQIPALRERGSDVLLLARSFLDRFSREYGLPCPIFSKAAEKVLLTHSWPGNVRELENRIQKSLIQCVSGSITPADLGLNSVSLSEGRQSLKEARESAEREVCERCLRGAGGNLTLAASMLGIDRKVLRELMTRLDLEKKDFKKRNS